MANPQAFSRLNYADPQMQQLAQDLYNKLAQAQSAIQAMQDQIATLQAQVKALQP